MKLRRILLSLSLAGLCFSQVHAEDSSANSSRRIGDGTRKIGDIQSPPTDGPEEVTPASGFSSASEPGAVTAGGLPPGGSKTISDYSRSLSDLSTAEYSPALDDTLLAPTAYSLGGSCDGNCDAGCGSCCDSGGCGLGGLLSGGSKRYWFGAETLLWFGKSQNTPPLVTTSASGVFPSVDTPGVEVVVGGDDGIATGILPGLRFEGGFWIDDCQKIGLMGRGYGIFEDNEEYRQESDGSVSIGLPFFNVNDTVLGEDAYLVAFTAANNELISEGSVHVRQDFDMLGAEASLRVLLGRSNNHRVDFVGGYTYNRLKSSLTVESVSINRFTGDGIPDGTVFTTNDLFETENEFNGGHLGILSSVTRRCISLSTLAKVSFGNMSQTGAVRGYTIEEYQGNSSSTAGGIYTQPSNIGTFQQDSFAFIPELGLKLGYDFNENLRATVGYTFMMWSSVALAGEQVDRVIDPVQVISRPMPRSVASTYWMQGLDLGFTFNY